jgi:hypothetical protein
MGFGRETRCSPPGKRSERATAIQRRYLCFWRRYFFLLFESALLLESALLFVSGLAFVVFVGGFVLFAFFFVFFFLPVGFFGSWLVPDELPVVFPAPPPLPPLALELLDELELLLASPPLAVPPLAFPPFPALAVP